MPEGTLKYHIPSLGELKSDLYTNSSKTFNLLNKNGHINRLKEIDQLGVIRNVYEGAHHSRWEYVMVQLGILHRLNTNDIDLGFKPSKSTGLSSNVSIGDGKTTYLEVIQMWILLLNMGHLPGTFSSEKAFLKCIKEDSVLEKIIDDCFLSEDVKSYFKGIVKNENVYEFHKILSFFYLSKYRESDLELIDYLTKILEFNCIGSHVINKYDKYSEIDKVFFEKARQHLKQIFFKIRQISYLYLDSKYGPTPFNFELETILINLPEYVSNLFVDSDSSIAQSINEFDKLLIETIYQSENSLQAHSVHVKKIYENTMHCMRSICDSDSLLNFLKNDHNFKYEYHDLDHLDSDTKIKFSLMLEPHILSGHKNIKNNNVLKNVFNFDFEDKLNAEYGIEDCIVSLEPNIKQDNFSIAFSFFKNCVPPKRFEILGKIMNDLVKIEDSINSQNECTISGFEKIYPKFILYALRQICSNNCIFKFNNYNVLDLPFIGSFNSNQISNKLSVIRESSSQIDNSRRHEILCFEHILTEICHEGSILVCPNQIKVLDRDRNELTDIDCMGFGYKNNRLHLLIVESKKQKLGSISDAKKQLLLNVNEKFKIKFENLNLKEENIKTIGKCVYCYMQI